MGKDPAFLLYYKDILVSCADWEADVVGWYTRLLCHQADKPDGLPNNIEDLAALASVKHSQYQRFEQCWKGTLAGKFRLNEKGKLVNVRQEQVLLDRKNYLETQGTRGVIGVLIKKERKKYNFTNEQWKKISAHLFNEFSEDEFNSKGYIYLEGVLQAYANSILGDVNENEDVNVDEEKYTETIFKNIDKLNQPAIQDKNVFPAGKKWLLDDLLSRFGFNESQFDKCRVAAELIRVLTFRGRIDYFETQMKCYFLYKDRENERKHSFQKFIGTAAEHYEDGGWNAENWENKYSTVSSKRDPRINIGKQTY